MLKRKKIKSRWWLLGWHFFLAAALMTLTRLFYYGYNYSSFSEIPFGELIRILIGGVRFDLAMITYALLPYLFISLLGAFAPKRLEEGFIFRVLKAIAYLVPMTFYLGANISDAGYYPYVLRRATSEVASDFQGKSMFAFYRSFIIDYWDIALVFLGFFILMLLGYFAIRLKDGKNESIRKRIGMTVLVVIAGFVMMRATVKPYQKPLAESIVQEYTSEPKYRPLVLNTPYTLFHSKERFHRYEFYNEEELAQIFTPVFRAAPLSPEDTLFGSFKGRNVMVILMESMSREFIGGLNQEIEGFVSLTPFLDSLLEKSVYAKYGFANGKRSVEAFPPIISSLPTFGGTFSEGGLEMYYYQHFNSIETGLPKSLGALGYDMKFYHADQPDAMGFMDFLRFFGMSKQYTMREYGNMSDYDGRWAIYDLPFLQAVAEDMGTLHEPFLSIFFSASNHAPFKLPEAYKDRFQGHTLPIHATVQYADYALKCFFDRISKEEWYENTLFVLTADHTNLSDHPAYAGLQGHAAIPIIFYDPQGKLQGMIDDHVVQHADIFPSLLYLMGDEKPILSYGSNMFDPNENHYGLNFIHDTYTLFHKEITVRMDKDGTMIVSPPAAYIQTEPEKAQPASEALEEKYKVLLRAIVQDYNERVFSNKFTLTSEDVAGSECNAENQQ